MSHVKASGKVAQHSQAKRKGRRHGLKKSGGQTVKAGHIILRQKGALYKPGVGVDMGRDYTIFAMVDGTVKFGTKHGKTVINVASAQ